MRFFFSLPFFYSLKIFAMSLLWRYVNVCIYALQVKVTPTRSKSKRSPESREPTEVVMAPFSGKSTVVFEDVPVTKTAKRLLRIINPSEDAIEVRQNNPKVLQTKILQRYHQIPTLKTMQYNKLTLPMYICM